MFAASMAAHLRELAPPVVTDLSLERAVVVTGAPKKGRTARFVSFACNSAAARGETP
jgi:hypothetical protein